MPRRVRGSFVVAALLALTLVSAMPALAFECSELSTLRSKAEKHDPTAELSLAKMTFYSYCGLNADKSKVFELTKDSADQRYPSAQAFLGYLYQRGIGTPIDDTLAVRWSRRAAEQGNGVGQILIGKMYSIGAGGLSVDAVEADKWYIIAGRGEAAGNFLSLARKLLELTMPETAIHEAERRAANWIPRPEPPLKAD